MDACLRRRLEKRQRHAACDCCRFGVVGRGVFLARRCRLHDSIGWSACGRLIGRPAFVLLESVLTTRYGTG